MLCLLTCCVLFFFFTLRSVVSSFFFFFNDTATTEIYTLSLHDALPISGRDNRTDVPTRPDRPDRLGPRADRSEEHTSELQSPDHLVCRLLLEKKKKNAISSMPGGMTTSSATTASSPSVQKHSSAHSCTF